MTRFDSRRTIGPVLLAFASLAVLTALMLLVRERLDKAHVALLYLLVVLGGSAAGRTAGLTLGVVAFVLFNFFFLPPFNTLNINDPLDWLVLIAFLITSIVAAELLDRQRIQATLAVRRGTELDQMATLGAETLNAARAEHALAAIVRVIRTSVGVGRSELLVGADRRRVHSGADAETGARSSEELLTYVLESGRAAVALNDGTVHVVTDAESPTGALLPGATGYAMPLLVRGKTVGVLRVSDDGDLQLNAEKVRVLNSLAYYAALAIDRLRLEAAEEATEELRRVDRLKDALLAAVSHDLRTPLTTIKGLAHEISQQGSAEAGERARIIESEADELSVLVDGLLELSQLNAHALPVRLEINTLDEVVGAALLRASKMLEQRIVTVTSVNEEMLVGRFDVAHSVRILVNLLENAAKYSPPSTPIDVTMKREGSMLSIAVSDRGPGIPQSDHARIFEPFFRSGAAPVDVRGAGLGLSIARSLAEAQHGSLAVYAREGGGSTFVTTVLAEDAPAS